MQVTLLTREHCNHCAEAKVLLNRLAAKYPLTVSTIDLDSPEGRALAERGGVLFPPGVFLDGEAVASGRIAERPLSRELDRRLRANEFCADSSGRMARLWRRMVRRRTIG